MTPILEGEAWVGVWIRQRSGPTIRGTRIEIGLWHRIETINEYGAVFACSGIRRGKRLGWPSGGARWEVARPLLQMWEGSDLRGEACAVCLNWRRPAKPALGEVVVELQPTEDDLDGLIDRILERFRQRAEVKL
jgi:hypothetical protein